MAKTVYRCKAQYAADMKELLTAITADPERDRELDRYMRAIVRAARELTTERERECLYAYYAGGENMELISNRFGISLSTVSRNISRGEKRLDWLIRLANEISPYQFTIRHR